MKIVFVLQDAEGLKINDILKLYINNKFLDKHFEIVHVFY